MTTTKEINDDAGWDGNCFLCGGDGGFQEAYWIRGRIEGLCKVSPDYQVYRWVPDPKHAAQHLAESAALAFECGLPRPEPTQPCAYCGVPVADDQSHASTPGSRRHVCFDHWEQSIEDFRRWHHNEEARWGARAWS